MNVSIIILNWNGGTHDCVEAVESALAQNYENKEIIFVDNGSSDDSCRVVKARYPSLRFVELEKNIGCPAGRNVGADIATGELLLFLENDGAWNNPNLIAESVKLFCENPSLAVVYTRVVGYVSGKVDPTLDGYPPGDETSGLYLSSSFRGGASIIRQSIFEAVGGFPSDFFRQGEERFVSLLVYQRGYKVAYWPEFFMRHKGSDYPGKSKIVHRLNFENELRTVARLYPKPMVFWISMSKILKYLIVFMKKNELVEYTRILARLSVLVCEKNEFNRISEKRLNLVEHLRRGNLHINLYTDERSVAQICEELKPTNPLYGGFKVP